MGCEPDDGSFLGTEMDVMAWSELIGTGNINIDYLYSLSDFPNDFFSWRPSLQTPASSPTVFVVSETSTNDVAYARITGTPAGGGVTSISAPANLSSILTGFGDPPAPQQPGDPPTIANAVDGRPTDAIWKDNRLAFVSTVPCDPPGGTAEHRDCVRVSELNTTNATPSVIQSFLVGEDAADLYMGGIGYALNDDLHVVYTRSSEAAGQYPSSYAAYQSAKAANNSLSTRALLSAGTGNYPGTRWGDYVGVAQDPQVPNAVWQGNEFSAGADFWATEVSQLQTGGNSYVPIVPVRVLDTRFGTGLSGVFSANVPRSFPVAGAFGIPANAVAVTGNVTIVGQTSGGYLSITPTPVLNPQSSTINFPLGDNRANNITTPLAGNGKLAAVYKAAAGRSTHLIVDITGYFLAGDADATYSTITPVRVLDSRPGIGIGLSGVFHTNTPRTLSIAGAHGIPANAKAVTANVTVVGQTKAGYLSITPDPDRQPDHVDPELPARRHAGERRVAPAERERRPLDRLQGHHGGHDQRPARRDRLLPRRPVRPAVLPADPGPDPRQPAGRAALGADRDVQGEHAAAAVRVGPLGRARVGDGDHGQPHGRQPDGRGLRLGDARVGSQPDHVDPELPPR